MKLFAAVLIFSSVAWGEKAGEHKHREHKAHQHGAAELAIAFQGNTGSIDLLAPSESVFGFEHEAKKETDKKKQQDGLALLENNLTAMIQFDQSLKCELTKDVVYVEREKNSKHSSVHAQFKVVCAKSPAGTAITFNIQKSFPKMKNVSAQLIVDDLQKSAQINKDATVVELKK